MNRLLQAARETIIFQGVDQLGISAIAARSGVNKVLVYRYFGGWNGIIEALFQQMLSGISEHADLISQSDDGMPSRLSAWESYILHFYGQIKTDTAFQVLLRWQMHNQEKVLSQRLNELLDSSIQQTIPLKDMDMKIFRLLMDGVTYSAIIGTGNQQPDNDTVVTVIRQIFSRFTHHYPPKQEKAPLPDACV